MASNSTENDEEIARALAEDYDYASNALLSESVQQPLSPPITITLPVEWSNKSSCCQKMESSSTHETDNDEQIAWLLHEEYESAPNALMKVSVDRPRSPSIPAPLVEGSSNASSYAEKMEHSPSRQLEEDAEMALILQIAEITLLENKINGKTQSGNAAQLEKTHADMTRALVPADTTGMFDRIVGMFKTIYTRYQDCHTKNQVLIDQMQRLATQLLPAVLAVATPGKGGRGKPAVATLAIGLVTNVLQGQLSLDDAKQIITNLSKILQEYNGWLEFLEQLVYILVAVTVPVFADGAMRMIKATVASSS